MKKKLLNHVFSFLTAFICMCSILAVSCSAQADAAAIPEQPVVSPMYEAVWSAWASFSINGSVATCYAEVTPKSSNSLTSVKGKIQIINSSGTVVKTYTPTLTKNGLKYSVAKKYTLPKKGTYYMKVTLTTYKNDTRTDKITLTTGTKTYS